MVRNYIRKTDRGMTYSKEKLLEAVAKVRSGELNGYEAAIRYKIPRTTLYDYAKGKLNKSGTLGKPPVLTREQEKAIAENLLMLEENGFNLGRNALLDIVALYINTNNIKTPFKSGRPGDCWLASFSKRNNVLTKPIYKEFGVQDKVVIMVKEFYSVLEMRIEKLNLADKPGQIWHIEEHCFYKGDRVNCFDKAKDLTVVTACSAEGRKAPFLSVTKGAESQNWMLGQHLSVSNKKGMCLDVFKSYFSMFLNYIDETVPNLVVFEGQSSLIDLNLVDEARKANVTIVKVPSDLDRLEISIARTLKLKWSQIIGEPPKEFATTVSELYDDLQEVEIREDFKNAGVYPFEAVCDGKFSSERLKTYDEYKWFKERHQRNMKTSINPEEVMLKEDYQMELEMDFDSSTSMSMTDEIETPNGACSGELLKKALISVKKGLFGEKTQKHSNSTAVYRELSTAEEAYLTAWVTDLTNAGFAITEDKLIEAVDNIQGNPLTSKNSHRYKYECFIRSHPKLKDKLAQDVPKKITEESIKAWLYKTRIYLKRIGQDEVLRNPTRIYNFGETVLYPNDDVTIFVTASAEGRTQDPSVIFPYKQTNPLCTSSWSKADLLYDQISDVFYEWLIEHQIQFPVLLFIDHETHITLPLYEFCKEKQITLLALPDAKIQPLEAIFRPLRLFWNDNRPTKSLKNEELAKLLENYIKQDFRKEIRNNFKRCGIYPFNANIEYNFNESGKETEKEERSEAKQKQISLLEEVEKRISKELLEEFQKAGDLWEGDVRHSSLFLFWKNIRQETKEDERLTAGNRDEDVIVEIFVEDDLDSVAKITTDYQVENI